MLLKSLISKGVEALSSVYPEREAREMVFVLLEHQIGTKRHTHIVEPGYEVSDDDASAAITAFGRMASGEPLQYVTGVADFYGRQFRVSPDVLIPRPETEILCREALSYGTNRQMLQWPPPTSWAPPPTRGCENAISAYLATRSETKDTADTFKILDLCTGSGCIAWTLALEMHGSEVTAVDISDGALAVASSQDFSEEIDRTGAVSPVFVKADVLAGPSVSGLSGRYDILVSNPPYVMDKEKALMRPNVLDHEPHLALFVSDEDPLVFYRAIAGWALAVLKPDGYGIVEINEALGLQTADLFRAAGLRDVKVIKDLSDRDRFVSFRR
ncbi:MAG: peptide chain release factor N(5)-glutamine methyltransferase [Bacteroidales bacterium]|nr:peptide chain release factor N(5)-glutamine methyltransferase [Bacteroidales bacterium]